MTLMEMIEMWHNNPKHDPDLPIVHSDDIVWTLVSLIQYEKASWGDDWESNITARMFFRKELDLL